jgi:hypothetical protein
MKTSTLCLLLLSFCSAFGQKCRYTIDKADPFTGEKVNAINYTVSNWTWISSKKGPKYFIEMSFQSVQTDKSMTPNDSMQVKFADGAILHLRPNAEAKPIGGEISTTTSSGRSTNYRSSYNNRVSATAQTQTTNVTTFMPVFEVDRGVYEKLAGSEISVVRFDFAGKPWDFDFSKRPLSKAGPQLMNNARCILMVQ